MILARQMCTVEALSADSCSGFAANTPQDTEESQLNLSESSYPSCPPVFYEVSLVPHMNNAPLSDRWISNAALHSKINPLSIQVGAMILSSQLQV